MSYVYDVIEKYKKLYTMKTHYLATVVVENTTVVYSRKSNIFFSFLRRAIKHNFLKIIFTLVNFFFFIFIKVPSYSAQKSPSPA